MLRIDEETGLGIALSLDANSRFSYLNPYLGAQLSLAEAYRNVAVTGAEPVAITDCLNFGSPEDPEVMWQFAEAILGLVDGCRELGVPVTGGNVSLYNQTATTPILPTPTIGVLGVIDDVATRIRAGFTVPGEVVLLLGETREELSGSIWEAAINDGHLGGMPPAVVLDAERALAKVMRKAAKRGLVSSAHDVSEGGLAVTLAESAFRGNLGFRVTLPGDDATVALFAESAARAVVSLPEGVVDEFLALCAKRGVPVARVGEVTAEPVLDFGVLSVGLDEAREAWLAPIPAALG
jgi:phosphoribosylformylglycinamidine synthase